MKTCKRLWGWEYWSKVLPWLTLGSILLAVIVCCHGCGSGSAGSNEEPKPATLTGKVTDAQTGLPVVNANVGLTAGSTLSGLAITDENGNYETLIMLNGTVSVTCTSAAEGYLAKTETLNMTGGVSQILNLS